VSRSERRATRIREEIRIDRVLARYDFRVQPDVDRDQQFSCTLHGDGTDSRPSARCYPENNSWYCWACSRSRDAIETTREMEGLDFIQALDKLEKTYGLPPLPWDDSDNTSPPKDEVAEILDAPYLDPVRNRVERLLKAMTVERTEPLLKVLKLWEVFDRARVLEDAGESDPMLSMLRALKRPAVTCSSAGDKALHHHFIKPLSR